MTKCGKYRDPNYIENYRKKNRDKFNTYTRNWIQKKRQEDPEFTEMLRQKARKYYAENKDWIKKRNKLRKEGVVLPDLRRIKKEQPDVVKHLSKCSHKKGVEENNNVAVKPILNINTGNFFIDWSV